VDVVALVVAFVGVSIAAWSAYSTRQQVKLARTQVSNQHRPVLVPVHGNFRVTFRGGEIHAHGPHHVENPPARDDLPPYSAIFLPVQNIGAGPALDVRGEFRGPRGTGRTDYHTGGVGKGQQEVVQFVSKTASLGFTGDDLELIFFLTYEDVTGQRYETAIRYDIGGNAYEVVHKPLAPV
jgi:hypothetical protein